MNVSNSPPLAQLAIDMPEDAPSPQVAIDMPEESPPPQTVPSGSLTRAEKVAAWVGSAGQQAIVSGVGWGVANKLPIVIGGAAGAAVGGPVGGAIGVGVGNVLGGVLLGPSHYAASIACSKLRMKMAHGFQYQPDVNEARAKKFTENTFIGTFSTVMGAKAGLKAMVPKTDSPWRNGFVGLGLDVGFSMVGGGLAQTVINARKALVGGGGGHGHIDYKQIKDPGEFSSREAITRMLGGGMAGVVGGLMDAGTSLQGGDLQETVAGTNKIVADALLGGAKSAAMLHTWFNIRATAAGVKTSNPGAATPTPAQPAPSSLVEGEGQPQLGSAEGDVQLDDIQTHL